MAKLTTKEAAIEKDQIAAIIRWGDGITINLRKGSGTYIKGTSYYTSIVQWWRSPCEVDLVLDKLPKYCCNKCCRCCNNNN